MSLAANVDDKTRKTEKQIDDVKIAAQSSHIEDLTQRGKRLENLLTKPVVLNVTSLAFKKTSNNNSTQTTTDSECEM